MGVGKLLILSLILLALTTMLIFTKHGLTPSGTTRTEQVLTTGSVSVNEEVVGHVTVVDVAGRTLSIPRNISRIIAIGPGALRLVAYLNAMDLVVGVEELEVSSCIGRDYAMAYCDYIKNLPVIGPGGPRNPPDPERIMQVKPQLIIMSRTYVNMYPPERLELETGVPVMVVDYGSPGYLQLEGLKGVLQILGKALNKEESANHLINYVDSVAADLKSRVETTTWKPSVYIGAVSYQGAQPFTVSQSMFAPLVLLNTSSIVDELRPEGGRVDVDFEWLIKRQPDFVFIDEGNLNVVIDDFSKNKERYCQLRVFREGRVYGVVPFNHYHTNIATAIANAYYIGKVLYPEAFTDIDPVEKADEVFKAFTGKPLYNSFTKGGYQGYVNLAEFLMCD